MYIRIRLVSFNRQEPDFIINISKNTYISDIMSKIKNKWGCSEFQQRLLYKGKQLDPKSRVIDNYIQLNDVIQLVIRDFNIGDTSLPYQDWVDVDSKFYEIGDEIEFRCETYFSWWRGIIVYIKKHKSSEFTRDMSFEEIERHFYFIVRFDYPDISLRKNYIVTFDSIRPRSTKTYTFDELKTNFMINVQYDLGSPDNGRWYDLIISNLNVEEKTIEGTLYLGPSKPPVFDVTIPYFDGEIFKVENLPMLDGNGNRTRHPSLTLYLLTCKTCKTYDNNCSKCGCYICGGKNDPSSIILCDECDKGYHYYCLNPQLPFVPIESEWYCPNCINISNIIVAGQTPNQSKKSARSSRSAGAKTKVWGRGMACVGRTKSCTIVKLNHFGPIPGVEVGMRWMFRIQVSEAGVHRPPVAGIHGRDSEGAYSLIMSGGYKDDLDNGNEFIYSGSGGRDFSGKKRRTGDQIKDQQLIRANKALAMNCYAKFNANTGAESKNWIRGKPVRVCRSYKLAKFSKYAPKEGIRYDGIYKVVKYYKEVGKSGYNVWKFLLRRDDPTTPPWIKDAPQFDVICPDGYWEAKEAAKFATTKSTVPSSTKTSAEIDSPTKQAAKCATTKSTVPSSTKTSAEIDSPTKQAAKCATKVAAESTPSPNKRATNSTITTAATRAAKSEEATPPEKVSSLSEGKSLDVEKRDQEIDLAPNNESKVKCTYQLDPSMIELIESDTLNERTWNDLSDYIGLGKYLYNLRVQEAFTCIVCKEVVYNPVTTVCNHNTCMGCLERSFKMKIYECPYCRYHLGKNYWIEINEELSQILNTMLPGYGQNHVKNYSLDQKIVNYVSRH